MPNTITSYITFSAGTKARASEVNTNFSNHRGTVVPINTDTATASDNAHDLGSIEHRWRTTYTVAFGTANTTTGQIDFLVNGSTIGMANASGIQILTTTSFVNNPSVLPQVIAATFASNGTWSRPTSTITQIFGLVAGGGGQGGGGGGSSIGGASAGGGGSGGQGGAVIFGAVPASASMSITVAASVTSSNGGAFGSGGNGTTGTSGGESNIAGLIFASGGIGGNPGFGSASTVGAGAPGGGTLATSFSDRAQILTGGGAGARADTTTAASNGINSTYAARGSGGTSAGSGGSGGGGGGGAGYGNGGNGGNGNSAGATGSDGTGGDVGGGGGGGAGGDQSGNGGAGGAGGRGQVTIYYVD